jgi:DNA-binding CsgD family transcriptional regulator
MYQRSTSEFIKFLAQGTHTVEEVLAHLVMNVMEPLQATSGFISKLDNENSIVTIGRFGIPALISSAYEERFELSDRLPITDAIRYRQIVAVTTLPDWPEEYSHILTDPYPSSELSFLAFPIELGGTPIAVGAVFFNERIILDAEVRMFIESIADLLALYLNLKYGKINAFTSVDSRLQAMESINLGTELSDRQILILQLISEGRTNFAIGEILQYSESTIRQETIKIFSKLGCHSRGEATLVYNHRFPKLEAVSAQPKP